MLAKFSKPPGCADCALERSGTGYAPAVGTPNARLAFVGEALGYQEAMAGEPFIGAAGGMLGRIFRRAEVSREQVKIHNCVNCFPGDTLIAAPDLHGAIRREYVGPMITATTRQGVLTGTPNHPVLTATGWKGLGELQEGDYLVRPRSRQSALHGDPNVQTVPSQIAEAFQTLTNLGRTGRMVGADVDFHGDGTDREIEIVAGDGLLGDGEDAAILDHLLRYILEPADFKAGTRTPLGQAFGGELLCTLGTRMAADGIVRPRGDFSTVLDRRRLEAKALGLRVSALREVEARESLVDLPMPELEPALDLFRTLASQVELCEVVGVTLSQFSGHVYNLVTGSHKYIANGFVVHNCQPPGDWLDGAPWQHSALTHCRQYLQETLDNPSLEVVVTLGAIPLKQVLDLWGTDGIRVQDFHGTVHRDPSDRYWVVPTYHPSHLQRGANNLFDVVRHDIAIAQRIVRSGTYARRPVSLLLDPPVEQFRRLTRDFRARVAHSGFGWLPVDIETPDKEGGRDEGELNVDDQSTQIRRINFSFEEDQGVTVPYEGPYLSIISELLGLENVWLALWNKWYDESRLRFNGHQFRDVHGHDITLIDGMWAAHHLQSDLPLGLGFWAPFYSDYGAWKHLGKQKGMEATYAAVDGLQTRRIVCNGVVPDLQKEGLWDAFWRHTHLREQYVLRPAHENGMPVSEPRLDKFHDKLQIVAGERLESINKNELTGNFHPKEGYAKYPAKACPTCKGVGIILHDPQQNEINAPCEDCQGSGWTTPRVPAGISGASHRKKGDHAKADYIDAGIRLVERVVTIQSRSCQDCGKTGVGPSHNCLRPRKSKLRPVVNGPDCEGHDTLPAPASTLLIRPSTESRWFWKLPFNPDANQQILKFIKASGETPGRAKKTRKETADKATLKKLLKKTGNPVYQHILDYKAVKKVDSTYAVGMKKRIWRTDGRLHPQVTFRPSMFRDSYVSPNPQNIIADKEGKNSLAAGFRHCIVADPGWRLLEIDYSGTEAVDTGWYIGDPVAIRLATLGVHAYLTSHLLYRDMKIAKPADLAWSDADLATFFSEIKKKYPELYDKAKRCVHGNNYGLTPFGMAENFPDVYNSVKEAQVVQDLYYSLIPGLPAFHAKLRDVAYETEQIGGRYVDDYYSLTSGKFHPFGYRHKFYGVMSYRPLSESEYRKKQWVAKNKLKRDRHPSVRMLNGRPFEMVMGEDAKRTVAMYPQSNSAGKLKEAELALLHPDSPDYIGECAEGHTPLVAPIHDSLLFHVPDRVAEMVMSIAVDVMRRPTLQMPCPAEWGIGTHIRTNVAVKMSPVGGSWGEVEDVKISDMLPPTATETLYLPVEEDQYEEIGELETRIA